MDKTGRLGAGRYRHVLHTMWVLSFYGFCHVNAFKYQPDITLVSYYCVMITMPARKLFASYSFTDSR